MMKGKLIVIEGSDASGKTTQLNLLKEYFKSEGRDICVVDFPRYDESFYGKLLKDFLSGKFGSLDKASPYIASVIFSLDRLGMKDQMESWLNDGKTIIANRYATSNMAHQAGRLPKEKREEFIKWNEALEYTANKIPKEDLVIFLHVPYQVSLRLLEERDGEKDMVEKDATYLKNAEEVYLFLAKLFPHWVSVECVVDDDIRSREDIHEEVKKILKERLGI